MGDYIEKLCTGQYSIQAQINNIIRAEKDWATKIRDKKYRETIRLELHQQTTEWCDYKANTCFCEDNAVARIFTTKGIL